MELQEVIRTINQMQMDGVMDKRRFEVILVRFGLTDAWKRFQKLFLTDGYE